MWVAVGATNVISRHLPGPFCHCLLHSRGQEWNHLPQSVSPRGSWDYSFNSTHQPPSAVICLFPARLPFPKASLFVLAHCPFTPFPINLHWMLQYIINLSSGKALNPLHPGADSLPCHLPVSSTQAWLGLLLRHTIHLPLGCFSGVTLSGRYPKEKPCSGSLFCR